MFCAECSHLDKERCAALKASEQAIEMHELLTQQVDRLRRERDLAYKQVSDLRKGDVPASVGGKIKWVVTGILLCQLYLCVSVHRECQRCKVFYIEQENGSSSCMWHPGVSISVIFT